MEDRSEYTFWDFWNMDSTVAKTAMNLWMHPEEGVAIHTDNLI